MFAGTQRRLPTSLLVVIPAVVRSYNQPFRLPTYADLERCRLLSALLGKPILSINPVHELRDEDLKDLFDDMIDLIDDEYCPGLAWYRDYAPQALEIDHWLEILVERDGRAVSDHSDFIKDRMRVEFMDGMGDFPRTSFSCWFDQDLQGEVDTWRSAVRHEAERRFPRYSPLD